MAKGQHGVGDAIELSCDIIHCKLLRILIGTKIKSKSWGKDEHRYSTLLHGVLKNGVFHGYVRFQGPR